MGAKFLKNVPFLGKDRKAGETITSEELGMLTDTSIQALVSTGILEIEGYNDAKGGPAMSAADLEALRNLSASFDKFRETVLKSFVEVHAKLDSLGASAPAKRAKKAKD